MTMMRRTRSGAQRSGMAAARDLVPTARVPLQCALVLISECWFSVTETRFRCLRPSGDGTTLPFHVPSQSHRWMSTGLAARRQIRAMAGPKDAVRTSHRRCERCADTRPGRAARVLSLLGFVSHAACGRTEDVRYMSEVKLSSASRRRAYLSGAVTHTPFDWVVALAFRTNWVHVTLRPGHG